MNYAFDISTMISIGTTRAQQRQQRQQQHMHSTFGKSLSKLIKWGDYWTICINLYSELVWCVNKPQKQPNGAGVQWVAQCTHSLTCHRHAHFAVLSIDSITHQNLFNIYRICSLLHVAGGARWDLRFSRRSNTNTQNNKLISKRCLFIPFFPSFFYRWIASGCGRCLFESTPRTMLA